MGVRAVIFDLGGTLCDKYSLSPLRALHHAFNLHGYYIDPGHISMYMGLAKHTHISTIICDYYREAHRILRGPEIPVKIYPVYTDFLKEQCRLLREEPIQILPGAIDVYEYLRDNHIPVGITTGYGTQETEIIIDHFKGHGLVFDSVITSDRINTSLPESEMIFQCMEEMGLCYMDVSSVLKVNNSVYGIKEGINAGCTTIGVARYSCLMSHIALKAYVGEALYSSVIDGQDFQEFIIENLDESHVEQVKDMMLDLGSDIAIDDLEDLPGLIERL